MISQGIENGKYFSVQVYVVRWDKERHFSIEARGYFTVTVGNVNSEEIQKNIEEQKVHH